jgi:hypothetical protein
VNRSDLYSILSKRLEQFRSFGYDAVRSLVNEPATSETLQVKGEDVAIEIAVLWDDEKRRSLRVCGTALGPSAWMTERLDERIIVRPSDQQKR